MYHDLLIKEDKTSAVIGRQLHVFCMDYIFSTKKKKQLYVFRTGLGWFTCLDLGSICMQESEKR